MKIHTRALNDTDFGAMRELLLRDGRNEWNHITDESIEFQFQLIREGKAVAVLAENLEIVGFAVLIFREACPSKFKKYAEQSSMASIYDVVVSSSESGKGLGSKLLRKSIDLARGEQCDRVFIERHEENAASAGMMQKAGFDLVETFLDPEKRTSGSNKTSVLAVCT